MDVWLEELAEAERKRALRARLAELEELRELAQEELERLRHYEEEIAQRERHKDAVLESYAGASEQRTGRSAWRSLPTLTALLNSFSETRQATMRFVR